MKRISYLALLPCIYCSENLLAKANIQTYGLLQSSALGGTQTEKYNKKCKSIFTLGSYVIKASLHNPILKTTFSANLDISADMSTTIQSLPIYNSVYLSATGPFGNIKIGNLFTAAMSHYIDGSSLMGGDSGIFGVSLMNMHNAASYSTVTTGVFYDPGYASAISYESPSYHGLQFAISYTPNSQSMGLLPPNDEVNRHDYASEIEPSEYNSGDLKCGRGNNEHCTHKNKTHSNDDPGSNCFIDSIDLMAYGKGGFTTDIVTAALYYNGGVPHHWNYSFALAYWNGKSNFCNKYSNYDFKIRRLSAFSLGFKLGFKHIKFGAGYVDEGKSCLPKNLSDLECFREANGNENTEKAGFGEGANAGKKYTAVLSYLFSKKIKLSLGGMYAFRKMSSKKEDKVTTKAGSVALDYFIVNGVSVYLGVNHAITKTCDRAIAISNASGGTSKFKDNKITYVSIGSKVTF